MAKKILVTGGAGFVGSHVADELLSYGHTVSALDNLSSQVHGTEGMRPTYLNPEVQLFKGDVRNRAVVREALRDVDVVFHFASAVGVGQSMYEISNYTSVNNLGTATLLEAVIEKPVEKLILASSMSLYGEGFYRDASGKIYPNARRTLAQLREGQWELSGTDGELLTPIPTKESKQPEIASVYALSKYDQESMCMMIGRAYRIPTVALRFFNIYGPRQALSNPYTGVLAIFAARLLNDKSPVIFEDGCQLRDFVCVHDVKRACRLAMEHEEVTDGIFNIGSGSCFQVREVAGQMARILGKESIRSQITGQYRIGDIRHCFADVELAQKKLGYQPRVNLTEGIAELASWLEGQAAMDRVAEACSELATRGLTV